jgi:hypothetical protein
MDDIMKENEEMAKVERRKMRTDKNLAIYELVNLVNEDEKAEE